MRALHVIPAACCLLVAACAATTTGTPSADPSAAANAAANAGDQVPVVEIPGARPAPRPLPAYLTLPPGPGPHPVVILLHGCSGITASQRQWSERLIGWGYATLVLDSFTPRGVTTVCPTLVQSTVTRFDRAGDAIAAARWLQTQPGVDGARIAVLGNSHGGGTAAAIASQHFQDEAHGLIKAAVDFYGACRDPKGHGTMPLLALAGDADTWGRPAQNCEQFAKIVGNAEDITVRTYPGAVHEFDNPRFVQRIFSQGHPLQYDPEAAEASYREVKAFLDRTIGPGTSGVGSSGAPLQRP